MEKCIPATVILLLAFGLSGCATRHASERSGKHLASKAEEVDCDQVIDYKKTQRDPKDFSVGYQAKMIVGEFAKGDTFNIKYQDKLYIPKAARGLVNINADYESTIYWCEGKYIGHPAEKEQPVPPAVEDEQQEPEPANN